MYRLVILNGKDKGKRIVVREPLAWLGRHPDCTVRVDDEEVRDRHAVLESRDDFVQVRSFEESRLAVNDAVLKSTRLDHDDILQVGSTQLQYQVMAETPFYEERRPSFLQSLSTLAITVVILAQAVIVGLLLGGSRLDRFLGGPAPQPPPAAPEPSAELQAELEDARARLARLNAESQQQSTEEIWAGGEAARLAEERKKLETSITQLEAQMSADSRPDAAASSGTDPAEAEVASANPDSEAVEGPVRTPQQEAEALLNEARVLVASNDLVPAGVLLDRMKTLAPAFVPGRITRARVLEGQKNYAAAVAEWDEILRTVTDPAMLEEATAARAQVARMESLARSGGKTGEEVTATGSGLPQRFRISALRRSRLPKREGFEEIRMIRFDLTPSAMEDAIRTDAVKIDIHFIDKRVEGDTIHLSRVPMSAKSLDVSGAWAASAPREFTVLYMVPEGFRERDAAERGLQLQFYGFVVRVLYDGVLQDAKAFPASLLDRSEALHAAE